jgi:ribA/ribD-fused uncharacterized protein
MQIPESEMQKILKIKMPNTYYFYDKETEYVKKEHICLNNFEESPFIDEKGDKYKSVEHYYQSHKFVDLDKNAFNEIKNCENADLCKKTARKYEKEYENKWDRKKWDESEKEFYMKKGLMFKFSQNLNMLKVLLDTGNYTLVERSPRDPFWGGLLPNSLNKLGEMLMIIRDNFKKNNGYVFIEGCGLEPIKVNLDY